MKIRRATIPEILAIDAQIFRDSGPPSDEELGQSAWWVAVDDSGKPVGYAGIWVKADKKAAYHTRVGVLPEARGRGLQGRFLRVREAHARKHGCDRAYTYVQIHNHPSSANLCRSGYVPYYTDANRWYMWWHKALRKGVKLKAWA
jgi:ribosomal protein S18 acetylase RimI-like enzyme